MFKQYFGQIKGRLRNRLSGIKTRKNEVVIVNNGIERVLNSGFGIPCTKTKIKIKGENNKISFIVDGEITKENCNINNTRIIIVGNNMNLKIHLPIILTDSTISLGTDFTDFELGKNSTLREISIQNWGESETKPVIKIGKGCTVWKDLKLFASSSPGFIMGDDCMLSYNITIWDGDGHQVTDNKTGEILNKQKEPLIIGNHVWISNNVMITKNARIPNNSIVGMGAVVSRKFSEQNTCIAGSPAVVVKTGIDWNRKNVC